MSSMHVVNRDALQPLKNHNRGGQADGVITRTLVSEVFTHLDSYRRTKKKPILLTLLDL